MPLPIEDYAAIGDGHTVALIGINGSLDWLCLPQFDSPACFAGLLGDDDNGHWLLGPAGEHTADRRYVDDTAVLETTYRTDERRGPGHRPDADRRAPRRRRTPGRGRARDRLGCGTSWVVRFDYGRIRPWVHREHDRRRIRPSSRPRGRTSSSSPARDCPTAHDGHPRGDLRRATRATGSTSRSPGSRRTAACPDALEVDERLAHTLERAAGLGRRLPVRRPVAPPGRPQPGDAPRAHPRATPAASSPRRPPRCPRTSAASATGTTATAGCATRP